MGLIVATANFYLTNAGKAAALDAANNSINIEVTKIAIGTAKYDAQVTAPTQTALTTEVGRYNLVGGGSSGQVLRLTTTLTPNYTAEIFEIGLFLSDGTLFAVAAVTGTDPLMQTANGLTSVITLGCSLAEVGSNVTVSVDANSPIAVVLMNQHIEHSDPHPQYLQSSDISGKYDKTGGLISGSVVIDSSYSLDAHVLSGAIDAIKGVAAQFNLATLSYIQFQHIPDILFPATAGEMHINSSGNVDFYEFDKPIHAPSFVGGNVSIAENGYTSLPNGLIMQWGRGRIPNGDNDVAFPIAFPNSLVNVQVTDEGAGSNTHGYNWRLSNNTKFRCTSQGSEALSYSYVALGY